MRQQAWSTFDHRQGTAQEIVEDLEAALREFAAIAEALAARPTAGAPASEAEEAPTT